MESAVFYDRLQFAFTATFHYLFPQLTMGLALLLLYFRTRALVTGDDHYQEVARFWTKIFGLSFAFGVVTGIPLEFQFGTNWAKFSNFAGGVIGQLLAMEGIFAFALESSFLGLLLYGETRFSRFVLWLRPDALSRLMAIRLFHHRDQCVDATSRWLFHCRRWTDVREQSDRPPDEPVYLLAIRAHDDRLRRHGVFCHGGHGRVLFTLRSYVTHAKTFVKTGVVAGAIGCVLLIFPTGDGNAKQVFAYQPIKGAAFEGLFRTERGADDAGWATEYGDLDDR